MLILLGAVASLPALAQQPSPPNPCAGDPNCAQASAAQLFELADRLFAEGDVDGAEQVLIALQQDPHPELRAEARFRLSALREKRGDIKGAIAALRDLLAEQPDAQRARLELGRLLAESGDQRSAQREFKQAQAAGLPEDVARTVSRFSNLLSSTKRRGGSIEITAGPDSNVNRSTGSQFIDTVIAPFELDPDARRQSGFGISAGLEGYSRDPIGKADLLTRGGVQANLFPGKGRFNDIQAYAGTGPEFTTRIGRVRPAATIERRWFGGDPYSFGYGGGLSLITQPTSQSQLEIDASIVRQNIEQNDGQDGTRYAAVATWDQQWDKDTTSRFNLRGAILDAKARPESLRQGGAEAVLAQNFSFGSAFASLSYTKTHGYEPFALFGKTRDDDRVDFSTGLVARRTWAGFAPLARLSLTRSWSNIALYEFKRARLDIGVTRGF